MNEQQATWYEVSHHYTPKITPVTIAKETEKTVSVIGKYGSKKPVRADKQGSYQAYFSTWEQAHAYLIGRWEAKVVGCRRALERAKSELGNINGMKRPESKEAA